MNSPGCCRQRGFTLLEVMVALTIFSLIATVTLRGLAISMDSFERVKHKTFASLIAQNTLTEMRLAGKMPAVTETKRDLEFASIEWKLVTKVSGTQDPNLVRIDFEVYRVIENADPFKEMDYLGFIGKQ
jgi:general secretion pathway protein I